jgi:hypothetical protein
MDLESEIGSVWERLQEPINEIPRFVERFHGITPEQGFDIAIVGGSILLLSIVYLSEKGR